MRSINRRTFLGNAAAMAGVGAVTANLETVRARSYSANDTIILGIIGSGGMGRSHMNRFKELGGIEWAAVCDVYEPNRNRGLEIAGAKAKGYVDYRELLERKDINAVLIASPEHWHHDHLIAALQAGKDVYCEKPMSWSIQQGENMVRQVRKTDRIVQIGMQRRSSPVIHRCKQMIDEGLLGEINLVRAEWYWNRTLNREAKLEGALDWERFLGPAPRRALDPLRFRSWRVFWDYSGGHMTDQGTHLMDVVQWMTGKDQPVAAQCYGQIYKLVGSETPDTFTAVFEYPGLTCTWTLSYMSSFMNGWGITFHGQKGTLELSEAGYRVYAEPWTGGRWEVPKPIREALPGGVTDTRPHIANFTDCVRTRKQPNAPVEVGHTAVRSLHLANQADKSRTRTLLKT
jgi:predicted dehydrogenase